MAEKETLNEAELISPEELAKFNGWAGPSNGGESDPEVEAAARRLIAIENTAVIDPDDPSEAPTPKPTPEPTPEPTLEVAPEATPELAFEMPEIEEGIADADTEPRDTQRGSNTRQERPGKLMRGAVAAGVAFGTVASAEALSSIINEEPEFSRETTTYILEEGDGLGDAAQKIQGIDTIDPRKAVHYIEVDPANTDVLKDGLHPGEALTIPMRVLGSEDDA